ncbi:hypothetical protein O3Q52_01665 [Streptomyces sp. ActVer]|uniref:hypothetical protein n=1 Tax=Streptomyces sp. ActVer TaxID=3014558 RepID=UPI0022B5CDB4|nr:hypothetical protein [Streptomyces sp. ActVer]MCZ4506935.1 hypothetical protein [Streptomyces sp. ActVer]
MTEPDAYDRLLAILDGVRERATNSRQEDFRLTGRWNPESQRVAYLFGKAYWWDADADGRLALRRADWM